MNNKVIDFYTIVKKEMNWATQKFIDKKYKFYHMTTKKGVKSYFLPPTYRSVLLRDNVINPIKGKLGFAQNTIPDDIAKRFAENKAMQEDCLRIIKKRREEFGYLCGIIQARTGVGKTHICMDIVEYLQEPTLILVTNKKLMSEMIDKFSIHTNTTPTQYGDGKKDLSEITVMTKTSYLNCPEQDLQKFKVILIDECHQGFSAKFIKKTNVTFDGLVISLYGLSATPKTDSLDTKDLEKYYGKIIEVGSGYDFIPSFVFHNYTNIEDYEYENYVEHRTVLSEDEHRIDTQIKTIKENLTSCSLILCDRIADVDRYYEKLKSKGNIVKITGSTKVKDDTQNLKNALEGGDIIIVGSIQKCATGFDFPKINSVFIFSSIKFENTVIQAIGRALRKSPGKKGAVIHVWNDKTLESQRRQKESVIKNEYGIKKSDITIHKLGRTERRKSQVVMKI